MMDHSSAHRFLALGLVLAACSPGDISTVQPGTGEGRIIRTTLTIHASVDSADTALAEALGWQEGVPDVEVQILRNGTREWLTARTDSTPLCPLEPAVRRRWAFP